MPPGSGNDLNKSEAVEGLWAAILGGTLTRALSASLKNRYEQTTGGAPFADIVGWLQALGATFPLPVALASRTSPDVNGDVDATLVDGSSVKFEVKAQVKKPAFADITQSDWIRNQTDLLSKLVSTKASVATHFDGVGAGALAGIAVDPTWSESGLHFADLAGITCAAARQQSGVNSPADLSPFVDQKWFLQVTQEGARMCKFSELAPIKHLLAGGLPSSSGRALQSLSPDGKTWFTYHLYPHTTLKGRHKMHAASFEGATWV